MIEQRKKTTVLLMADDDEDDCIMVRDAIREVLHTDNFRCLCDGEELMDYLLHRGIHTDPETSPPPDLILLDLNMPVKNGFETLIEIRNHPQLRAIPILIFSTTRDQREIELAYKLGANSYITKPTSFEDLIRVFRNLADYWFGIASLPRSQWQSTRMGGKCG